MLRVCSTRPVHGTPKYSAVWLAVFHPNEPTRPPSLTPSASSTPATCRARVASSAKVIRSWSATRWVSTVLAP